MSQKDLNTVKRIGNQYRRLLSNQHSMFDVEFEKLDYHIQTRDIENAIRDLIVIFEVAEENDLIPSDLTYPGPDEIDDLIKKYNI